MASRCGIILAKKNSLTCLADKIWLVPGITAKMVQNVIDESRTLNPVISRTEREIDLLREYRTRLIADVVTGKLDVREAAALLPDEVEVLECLDEIDDSAEIEDLDAVAE